MLLRGGLRSAEPCVVEVVAEGAGEGVDDISTTSSVFIGRLVKLKGQCFAPTPTLGFN